MSVSLPESGRFTDIPPLSKKREEGRLGALDLAHVTIHSRHVLTSNNKVGVGGRGRLSLPMGSHHMKEYQFSGARRSRTSVTSGLQFPLGKNSSTSSVFSTAVISGAASAPNLTDIVPNTASLSG